MPYNLDDNLNEDDRNILKKQFETLKSNYKEIIQDYKERKTKIKETNIESEDLEKIKELKINKDKLIQDKLKEYIDKIIEKYVKEKNVEEKILNIIEKKQPKTLAQIRTLVGNIVTLPSETKDEDFKNVSKAIITVVETYNKEKEKISDKYQQEKNKLLIEIKNPNSIITNIRNSDQYFPKLTNIVKQLKAYVKHISADRPDFDSSVTPLKKAIEKETNLKNTKKDIKYHLAHRLSISDIINTLKEASTLECIEMIISILVPVRKYGELEAGNTIFLEKFLALTDAKALLKRLNSSPFNLRAGDPNLNSSIQENFDGNVDVEEQSQESTSSASTNAFVSATEDEERGLKGRQRRLTLTSEQLAQFIKNIEDNPRTSTNVVKINLEKIESLVSKAPMFNSTKSQSHQPMTDDAIKTQAQQPVDIQMSGNNSIYEEDMLPASAQQAVNTQMLDEEQMTSVSAQQAADSLINEQVPTNSQKTKSSKLSLANLGSRTPENHSDSQPTQSAGSPRKRKRTLGKADVSDQSEEETID